MEARVPSYLVELYVSRSRAHEAVAAGKRAQAAAAELSAEGVSVRYVRTTFLPEDETCFHVFAGASADSVREACRRAGFGHARISLAVE
jgi:hypothetical protein